MWKITRGFLIVAVALVAGCGAAGTTGASRPAATGKAAASAVAKASSSTAAPQGRCAPGAVGPLDASFASASDGWLLGVTLQNCWTSSASRLVVRKTTDGGRVWVTVPAPPAPFAGGATVAPGSAERIYFADSRDGWVFGPGLWSTHDGGATWHRVDTGGRAVYSLAATEGHAVAAYLTCGTDCGRGAQASFAIETAPAGSDGWRPVPGGTGNGQPQLLAAGGIAYALVSGGLDGTARARLLTGPADGTAAWRAHGTPCYTMGANTGTALTASSLVITCALLGAHPAATRFYRSGDSGASWRQFSYLGLYDGASSVSVSPGGTLLVGANFDTAAVSRDGGHSWLRPASMRTSSQAGCCALSAAMTSDDDGYVVAVLGPLWITGDGGRTWAAVTVR